MWGVGVTKVCRDVEDRRKVKSHRQNHGQGKDGEVEYRVTETDMR